MRYTRSTALAATAAAALMALAGCSSSGDDSDGAGGGDVDLKVWMATQEPTQKEAIDTVIADFEAANPGITVTLEERAVDSHKDALRQVAGTDSGPDIYWYWEGPGLGGELVENGMSLDLTEYYDQYKWEDRFSDAALAGITQYGGFDGIPWTMQGEAIYYNKTLFEQAGISETPATYEDLVAAADKLVAAGITPIQFGGTVNWHVMRLLDALIETKCGADLADTLNTTQAGWDTEECVTEAFTELKTWGDTYLNEGFMGINNDDSSQLFYTGEAAMAFEGTWFDSNVAENGMNPDEVGIFTFPTDTGRLYGFGEGFYVNATTTHADEAAKFLDFGTATASQEKVVGAWAAMSVNNEVDPSTDNALHGLWPDIFNAATGLYVNNDQNLSLDQTTEYWRIQNSVLTGDIAPADAGAEFQKFVDAN
ncbi:ABC transporter substrate-binding protein [Pengzhenrongella frigida]|uniref:Extracellular solute-binding protein n=1 Tax=Pengzhenrongella frigida TaxID=1259133 RepID=A0A4Q5MZL5_9MICO|nr:extracellular solute-binding protein [Cellulomonas sp. HLT2-17]RYV51179.1 extracellular solute-binding protein [Cellulomonas sp. HLT2-17]